MKRNKIFAMVALLAFGLTSCVKNIEGGDSPVKGDPASAFLSIKIDKTNSAQTRGGSSEQVAVQNEGEIYSLYLITFDASGQIIRIPGGNSYYISISESGTYTFESPSAVKVSSSAENLVAIANPGPQLMAKINALNASSTWAKLNEAISGITVTDIANDNGTQGFAMISSGSNFGSKSPTSVEINGDKVQYPYVDIKNKMVVVTTTEADAKQAAEAGQKVQVRIERLASKLVIKEKVGGATPTIAGAKFTLLKWTVDVLNTTYFPFAEKTLRANHATGGQYAYNFYTKDPNYDDQMTTGVEPVAINHTGLAKGTVTPTAPTWSYEPILPWTNYYGWKDKETLAFVTENTMASTAQRYGNATRIVMKATYTPPGFTEGADWFHWSGTGDNFQTLTDMQTKYTAAGSDPTPFTNACDKFYTSIKRYYTESGQTLTATKFSELVAADITPAKVPNGGQVVKDGSNDVIRWYQGGLNYYYYEIRHDNEADGHMLYAKYGVVRNNWYNLTLNTVSGQGTPWYPDVDRPGPGDPDPKDPIDTESGYLGITITPEPWFYWETGMNI